MTKEQELMQYLHENVFDPTLASKTASANIKSGIRLTIGRMNRLSADKMLLYFWSALATKNSIAFSKRVGAQGLTRFEDVLDEFRDRFNEDWLRGKSA